MRSKYLTTTKEYNKRIDICKSCEHFFKPTGSCKKCGCFVRIKAKISTLNCPIDKWRRTTVVEPVGTVSPEILKEIKEIWPDIINKKAKNHIVKNKLIELYNTIYGTGFSNSTSCGSCLNTVYQGIEIIYKEHIENIKPKKDDCNC